MIFPVAENEGDVNYSAHPDKRIGLGAPEMLSELRKLADSSPHYSSEGLPAGLAAPERRSYTANDIFRNPAWRKRDADGALRISPEDAALLGLDDGGRARISTARGSAEAVV